MPTKMYAVLNGRSTGIFRTWADCEKQVKGYPGARYKSFPSLAEAMQWLGLGTSAEGSSRTPSAGKLPTAQISEPSSAASETIPPSIDHIIYTDGSCLKNPNGPGGWAAIIEERATGSITELHGGEPSTTNNRMELAAAIAALSHFTSPTAAQLYTDSQYLKNAFTKHWIANWKRNGWKTATGGDVKNKELWLQLDSLCQKHRITFQWVKGHAGNPLNERCDKLAKAEAQNHWKTK